jgi:hypothetical protein
MRQKILIALFMTAFSMSIPGNAALATPTPPYVLVNETTLKCYIAILGDECSMCDPPPGWKVLGVAQDTSVAGCPAGYTKIEQLATDCRVYKDRYCCTEYFSGDCEDLVVNKVARTCAFVDDINNCILPPGWSKRPADITAGRWRCPTAPDSYEWKDPLACLTTTATVPPLLIRNEVVQRHNFTLALSSVLVLVCGGVLAWLVRRRVRRQ